MLISASLYFVLYLVGTWFPVITGWFQIKAYSASTEETDSNIASPAESISTAQKSWITTKQNGSQLQLRVTVLHACNKDRFFWGQDRDSQTVAICIHRRRDYHQGTCRYMVVIVKRCFSQHLLLGTIGVFFPFFPVAAELKKTLKEIWSKLQFY